MTLILDHFSTSFARICINSSWMLAHGSTWTFQSPSCPLQWNHLCGCMLCEMIKTNIIRYSVTVIGSEWWRIVRLFFPARNGDKKKTKKTIQTVSGFVYIALHGHIFTPLYVFSSKANINVYPRKRGERGGLRCHDCMLSLAFLIVLQDIITVYTSFIIYLNNSATIITILRDFRLV